MTRRKPLELLVDYSLHIAIIILAVICAFTRSPKFLEIAPLDLIKRTTAYICLALAMGSVMRVGEIDLSLGQLMGFLAVFVSMFLCRRIFSAFEDTIPHPVVMIVLVFLSVIILGALVGFINGLIVTKLKVPSFLSTLAMQLILFGSLLLFLSTPLAHYYISSSISGPIPELRALITHTTPIGSWNVPNYVWFGIGMTIIVGLLWHLTRLGKNMKIVGANRAAAEDAGVNVNWTVIFAFMIAGVLAGICGMIEGPRVGGAGVAVGKDAEFSAIIACLLGGFSLRGGKGNIFGLIVGVVFCQLLTICLQWVSIPGNLVYIIMGVVIIAAVVLNINRFSRDYRKPEVDEDTAPMEIVEE